MFKSISWQDFITGIAAILGIYYVVSILLLYSRDAIRWLKKNRTAAEESETDSVPQPSSFMGAIKAEPPKKNEQSLEAGQLVVGEPTKDVNEPDDSLLVGSVSDLLHEVKILTRVIKESGGSKDDSVQMLQSLLSNYPQLIGTKYQGSVSIFIHQHLASEGLFEVELNDIISWWPVLESQDNQNNSEV